MKQTSILYESEEHLQNYIKIENFNEENLLVFLFSDEPLEKVKKIIKEIKKMLPKSLIIGSSSGGTIHKGNSINGKSLITFCHFKKIKAKGIILSSEDFTSAEMALEINKQIISENSKMLFLFDDGMEMNSSELLNEISSILPDLPLAGGKAGNENYILGDTYIFLNEKIISKGAVAVSLNGEYLRVSQQYRLNWKKIGKKMRITEAEGNIIKSIDNTPILELYEKYMGSDFALGLPETSGMEFPFIVKREGIDIARSLVQKLPDGSVSYHGDVKKGEKVQFSFGHIPVIIDEVGEECRRAAKFQPEGILIFSCLARKNLLQKAINYELAPFGKIAPMAGFFTLGEFFHKRKQNFLLNITMTILLLSEEPINNNVQIEDFFCFKNNQLDDRQLNITKTLIHLMDQVSNELEEKNIILKNLSYTDSLTGLYNHRFFVEALENEIKRALRYDKKLSLAILDIDNFKEINDLYGHDAGDKVLIEVASKVTESCRETDIICRYGGDEIVVILIETGIEKAQDICERINHNLRDIKLYEKNLYVTLSSGLVELDSKNSQNILKKADERLYKAKNKGKNNIICTD